jgi:glycosyltransferase involved in cell wall biosynthesis
MAASAQGGISGGVKVLVELIKAWASMGFRIELVTTEDGAKLYDSLGVKQSDAVRIKSVSADEVLVNHSDVNSLAARYVYNTLLAIPHSVTNAAAMGKNSVIFTPSAYFPNVFPAFVAHVFLRRRWFTALYHFVPVPASRKGDRLTNLIAYSVQNVSLLLCRRADAIVTESSVMKKEISKRLAFDPARILVASGGIDKEVIDKTKRDDRFSAEGCYIGRIHPTKGVFDIPKIWKIVAEGAPNCKLLVVGPSRDAGVLHALKREIAELGLESNVIILGLVSEAEKFTIMKSCKILLHPSYEEGVPVSFIEAAYCGLKIVTYYLPNYVDIKDWLYPAAIGDISGIAFQCRRALHDDRQQDGIRNEALEHEWKYIAERVSNAMNS